jgi:hypothetical protein
MATKQPQETKKQQPVWRARGPYMGNEKMNPYCPAEGILYTKHPKCSCCGILFGLEHNEHRPEGEINNKPVCGDCLRDAPLYEAYLKRVSGYQLQSPSVYTFVSPETMP